jgi:hypothetical protein
VGVSKQTETSKQKHVGKNKAMAKVAMASKQTTFVVEGKRNSRKKKQPPQYKTTKHLNNKK